MSVTIAFTSIQLMPQLHHEVEQGHHNTPTVHTSTTQHGHYIQHMDTTIHAMV